MTTPRARGKWTPGPWRTGNITGDVGGRSILSKKSAYDIEVILKRNIHKGCLSRQMLDRLTADLLALMQAQREETTL